MPKVGLHLRSAFYAGDYKGVVAQSVDSRVGKWDLTDIGILLGALCFLGRVDEAMVIFELHRSKLSEARRVECRFFIGIGLTRRSDYVGARRQFGANIRSLRHRLPAEALFFAYQGIAFYRYFCGRWTAANRAAERSFRSAISAKFLYGRVLSADLRGHVLVQTGKIGDGLRHLAEAEDLSRKLRNFGVAEAIRISIATYEAEFGLSLRDSVTELESMIAATSIQDTYSRATLGLELARQLMLRGLVDRASSALDQVSRVIYVNQNRRQEVTLNLRYARLAQLAGETARGLNYVQSARRALDPDVDHALELMVLGQELALAQRLEVPLREDEIRHRIAALSGRYGGSVNQRILARDGEKLRALVPASAADRLGRLLDQAAADSKGSIPAILRSGLHGLLYAALSEAPKSVVLYLDLEPGTLTFLDHGQVGHARGLTAQSRKILHQLALGNRSKEDLIRSVWGYAYHPLRHDSLVYTTLASLRKLLGSRAHWVETTETGYRLASNVALRNLEITEDSPLRSEPLEVGSVAQGPGLGAGAMNHRQLLFLKENKRSQYISVEDYRKQFKVSPMTALRDLTGLHQAGLVVRVGRARATRYIQSGSKNVRRGISK